MECQECQREVGKIIFFRQGHEKEKFCSNERCDKYWENSELHCYKCNMRINEGEYYYNHNDDPKLKICVRCRDKKGKTQAEKDKEKAEQEIAELKREIQKMENNPQPSNPEYHPYLNHKKQMLQAKESQLNKNNPQQKGRPNQNTSNPNNNNPVNNVPPPQKNNNPLPNQNNNQNQSVPNPVSNPILPNSVKEWFKENSVKLIKLADKEWIIEYNNGSKLTIPVVNVSELQEAKSYLQAVGKNSLSASELNISSSQPSNNPSPSSNLPLYIGGGIIVFLLVVIIVLLARKKEKEKY